MWAPRRCRLRSGRQVWWHKAPALCIRAKLGRPSFARMDKPEAYPTRLAVAVCLLLSSTFLLRGELEPWVQHIPSGPAIAALFRGVPMPGETVPILLPPAETRPALTNLISGAPRDAMLYRLRAQEAEVALDFAAAEADWKSYTQHAADSYAAQIELADFYHRRIRPREEMATLSTAAADGRNR